MPEMRDEEEPGGPQEVLPTELDCNLGAIGHLLDVIPVVGILVTLVVWQWRGRESKFLEYQARQAATYQAAVLGAMVVVAIVLWIFGKVPVVGGLFRAVDTLTVVLIWLGGLALAVNAAIKVRQGVNYKYPVVSNFLSE